MDNNLKKKIRDRQMNRYHNTYTTLLYPGWSCGIELENSEEIYLEELISMVRPYCWKGLCFNYLSAKNKDKHNFFSILIETIIEPTENHFFCYENKEEVFNISDACLTKILIAKLRSYQEEEDVVEREHFITIISIIKNYYKKSSQSTCSINQIDFSKIRAFNLKDISSFDYLKYISVQEHSLNEIEDWYENFEKFHQMKLRKRIINIFQGAKNSLYRNTIIDLLFIISSEKKINSNFSEELMKSIIEVLTTLAGPRRVAKDNTKYLAILDNVVEKMDHNSQNPIIDKIVILFRKLRKNIYSIDYEGLI